MTSEDDLKSTTQMSAPSPAGASPHWSDQHRPGSDVYDGIITGLAGRPTVDPGNLDFGAQQVELMFETASVGMALLQLDGAYLRANSALCTLLQRSEPELRATTREAITHPDDVEPSTAHLKRVVDGHQVASQFETRFLLPGGRPIWAMVTVSLVKSPTGEPELFTSVVDLVNYRDAEKARDRLAAIASSSMDAVIAVDLSGKIVTWNHGANGIFGYSNEEALERDISLITATQDHETVLQLLDRVEHMRTPVHAEFSVSPRYGPPIDVAVTVAPICDSAGRLTGASIVARDISEQRWLAETLNQTLAALEEALAEARESESRSRRFLANAAHQLRTPITGIRACAETLLRGAAPADADRLLSALARETFRVSRLVTALLRMSHLDQGEEVVLRPCDVSALCRDELERMLALRPGLETGLLVGIATGTHPTVDSHALREILSNLLDNARRHAREKIGVMVELEGPLLEIRVHDDGPGLEGDDAVRAFERFVSLDDMNGSGLGLPIARELARHHGGDVVYEQGAFVVTLLTVAAP